MNTVSEIPAYYTILADTPMPYLQGLCLTLIHFQIADLKVAEFHAV